MNSSTFERSQGARWITVTAFAIAMAWVEAAVVFYLRTMIGRIDPHQTNPLPVVANLGTVELVREAATLLMLLMVGILAGQTWRSRLGYAAIAFGFWDIFYYVFLRLMCGWPRSAFDWDVLFLLPLPWWGPVLAPVLIAVLMISWGTLVNSGQSEPAPSFGEKPVWLLSLAGIAIALYVFMADSLAAMKGGANAVRTVLPESFRWRLFGFGFVLMCAPVIHVLRHRQRPRLQLSPELAKIEPR
jgi:hypothetical protein